MKNQPILTSDLNRGAVSVTSGEQPRKGAVIGEHTDGKGHSLTLESKAKPMQGIPVLVRQSQPAQH